MNINQEEYFRMLSEMGCVPPRKMWGQISKKAVCKPNYYCLLCKKGNVNKIYGCSIEKWCKLYLNAEKKERFTIEMRDDT